MKHTFKFQQGLQPKKNNWQFATHCCACDAFKSYTICKKQFIAYFSKFDVKLI